MLIIHVATILRISFHIRIPVTNPAERDTYSPVSRLFLQNTAASIFVTGDTPKVAVPRPEIAGTVEAGSTVEVVIKDDQNTVVENAGGVATVDGAGGWEFTPAADLAVGTCTVEVTATKNDNIIKRAKTIVVVDKTALQAKADEVNAENLAEADYPALLWTALTPIEYDLLHFLACSPNKVYSPEATLREVWKYDYFGDIRTVDTHVKRLRVKLGSCEPDVASMIVTVRGIGYELEWPKSMNEMNCFAKEGGPSGEENDRKR